MLEVGQYTNEELIQMHRNGVEFAADVLWEQNLGVTHILIMKIHGKNHFKYNDLMSIAHLAFTRSLMYFNPDKGFKFNSLYGRSFFMRLSNEVTDSKRCNRQGIKHVSAETTVTPDGITIGDLMKYNANFEDYEHDYQVISEAFQYGLDNLKVDYHPYVVEYVFGDSNLTMEEIAEKITKSTGIWRTHQAVSKAFQKFRKNVQEYLLWDENKRIIETNKKAKTKTELLKVI